MKIYFTGSIRGGLNDREIYLEFIDFLKKNNHVVLTEHIFDIGSSLGDNKEITSEYIYERDIEWIKESDIVVAEVTQPSLSVGYEIAFAESLNKKIICLYREQENKRLSAMIEGNKNIVVIRYNDFKEIKEKLLKKINDE
jgi:2'-deoxynucleoside 5'-phosphate N-hydrolase